MKLNAPLNNVEGLTVHSKDIVPGFEDNRLHIAKAEDAAEAASFDVSDLTAEEIVEELEEDE